MEEYRATVHMPPLSDLIGPEESHGDPSGSSEASDAKRRGNFFRSATFWSAVACILLLVVMVPVVIVYADKAMNRRVTYSEEDIVLVHVDSIAEFNAANHTHIAEMPFGEMDVVSLYEMRVRDNNQLLALFADVADVDAFWDARIFVYTGSDRVETADFFTDEVTVGGIDVAYGMPQAKGEMCCIQFNMGGYTYHVHAYGNYPTDIREILFACFGIE